MAVSSKIKSNPHGIKPIFKTAKPHAQSPWPVIDPENQRKAAEALLELLGPIGEHRSGIRVSKGRRAKKLKRKYLASDEAQEAQAAASDTKVSPPLIQDYITVGYNTSIRAMTAQVSASPTPGARLGAVFLAQDPHLIQYAHLPVLASQADPPIPLITLPSGCDAKLCKALGVARVGIIGVQKDAPGAAALLSIADEVELANVPYFNQLQSGRGQWLGVQVESSSIIE